MIWGPGFKKGANACDDGEKVSLIKRYISLSCNCPSLPHMWLYLFLTNSILNPLSSPILWGSCLSNYLLINNSSSTVYIDFCLDGLSSDMNLVGTAWTGFTSSIQANCLTINVKSEEETKIFLDRMFGLLKRKLHLHWHTEYFKLRFENATKCTVWLPPQYICLFLLCSVKLNHLHRILGAFFCMLHVLII